MKIFKFKDKVDGRFAFVLAKDRRQARESIESTTTVPFVLVTEKDPADLKKPIIIFNQILPF